MDNDKNEITSSAPTSAGEPTTDQLSALNAALAETKAALVKAQDEAEKTRKANEELNADYFAKLEALRAESAKKDADFAEARSRWEADSAAAAKAAQEALEKALAGKDAEIAELKAAAKTAEQIAAEKYGAALPAGKAPGAVPAEDLQARWDAVKGDPTAASKFVRGLSDAELKSVLKGAIR